MAFVVRSVQAIQSRRFMWIWFVCVGSLPPAHTLLSSVALLAQYIWFHHCPDYVPSCSLSQWQCTLPAVLLQCACMYADISSYPTVLHFHHCSCRCWRPLTDIQFFVHSVSVLYHIIIISRSNRYIWVWIPVHSFSCRLFLLFTAAENVTIM